MIRPSSAIVPRVLRAGLGCADHLFTAPEIRPELADLLSIAIANNDLAANIFTAGESGTNAGGLNAILVDPITNLVIASVPVAANGTYSFTNVPSFANLRVLLSTTAGTAGSAPPATGLPTGWSATSPTLTNTTGDINTGSYNASDAVRFGATDDTNNDFCIQRTPESAFNLQANQGKPGGFNSATVPAGAFQTNNVGVTPNTQDYDGGTVNNIRITAFPANANSITINGVIYTNGGTCPPAASCTPWPGGDVTVPYTNGTGPSQAISVDPVEGNVDVVIPFVAVDNPGKEDATPGSVTLPFPTITLSGTVWNDLDGNLSHNGVEIGWYRKTFLLPAAAKNKNVSIEFDGVYKNSEMWINGNYLGRRPYGYINFSYDLTPYLFFDKQNVITVKAHNTLQPDSRWYTGSGTGM